MSARLPHMALAGICALSLTTCTLFVAIDDDLSNGADAAALVDSGVSDVDASAAVDGTIEASTDADGSPTTPTCPAADPTLVGYWPFDEDAGTTAKDCSSSKYDALSIGSTPPKWVAGKVGGAIDLDGQNTCLALGAADKLTFDNLPFTVAAWLNVRVFFTPAVTGRFVIHRKVSPNGWHFGTDDPSAVELDLEFGAGNKLQAQGTVLGGTWTHVAITLEPGNEARVYVAGALVRIQPNIPQGLGVGAGMEARIGCRSLSNNHFDGQVDELRAYSRVLSPPEIAALAK